MKKLLLIAGLAFMLTGCATADYKEYLTTQEKISADNKASANVTAIAMQKIADGSDDPTVKAVAAMMLVFQNSKQAQQVVAAPQNPALEWFKASTPLLGTIINGHYSLRSQEVSTNGQVEMYSTQIDAFKTIAVEGIRKEPLPVVVVNPVAEPAPATTP